MVAAAKERPRPATCYAGSDQTVVISLRKGTRRVVGLPGPPPPAPWRRRRFSGFARILVARPHLG